MSKLKKAENFDLALSLLIECQRYIEKSYSGTPGRTEILNKIEKFEDNLADDFSQKGEL